MVKEIANDSHQTEDRLTPLAMFGRGHLIKTLILILRRKQQKCYRFGDGYDL